MTAMPKKKLPKPPVALACTYNVRIYETREGYWFSTITRDCIRVRVSGKCATEEYALEWAANALPSTKGMPHGRHDDPEYQI